MFGFFDFFDVGFDPFGEFDTLVFEDFDDAGAGLGAVVEVGLGFLFIENGFFGSRIVTAQFGHDTPGEGVTLRFLDDYSVHR